MVDKERGFRRVPEQLSEVELGFMDVVMRMAGEVYADPQRKGLISWGSDRVSWDTGEGVWVDLSMTHTGRRVKAHFRVYRPSAMSELFYGKQKDDEFFVGVSHYLDGRGGRYEGISSYNPQTKVDRKYIAPDDRDFPKQLLGGPGKVGQSWLGQWYREVQRGNETGA